MSDLIQRLRDDSEITRLKQIADAMRAENERLRRELARAVKQHEAAASKLWDAREQLRAALADAAEAVHRAGWRHAAEIVRHRARALSEPQAKEGKND